LDKLSKTGNIEATYASNIRKEKSALEAGDQQSAYGYAAENQYINKYSDEIVKSGEMVRVPNRRLGGRAVQQEVDVETATEIREVKSGKLTGGRQAERLKKYADLKK
jgi:hypothetical protein